MMKRRRMLLIVVPLVLAIVVGVITTLSLPFNILGPERISIYDTTYEVPDFKVDDVRVKYFDADELTVWFYISGGNGERDLRFEFICRDSDGDLMYANSTGSIMVETAGYSSSHQDYRTNPNSTLSSGDLVIGVLEWPDVPSYPDPQRIKAVIDLDGIAVDTESFHIELRQLN